MINFRVAAEKEKSQLWKNVYSILGKSDKSYVADGIKQHSRGDIEEVQQLMWQETLSNRARSGENYQSYSELKSKFTKDAFFNPMTKIGTGLDPSRYNMANIPVAISPFEASSIYTSGGLAAIIIDKKARGISLNGYDFKSSNTTFWSDTRKSELKSYLEKTDFVNVFSDAMRDGLLYGGSVIYPVFKKDTPQSFAYDIKRLLTVGYLDKGCIDRWVEVDRWNTVLTPNYNISAKDYLSANSYYVPLSGIEVATQRSMLIKPKKLPYWAAIRQLGWGVSDYEGYIGSVLGYNLSMQSIPLMAQQMSLLLYEMPQDTLFAQLGVDAVKELMQSNKEQMKNWSMANPTVLNAFGKVYTVNRNYGGYTDLLKALQKDIASQSGIPDTILFNEQSKSFVSSPNEEAELKQTETIKLIQQQILPEMNKLLPLIIVSCFGKVSKEVQHCDELLFDFDLPISSTPTENANIAARLAASMSSFMQAGVPLDIGINLLKQYFSFTISSEDVEKLVLLSNQKSNLQHTNDLTAVIQNAQLMKELLTDPEENKEIINEPVSKKDD